MATKYWLESNIMEIYKHGKKILEQKRERSLKLTSKDRLCKQGQLPSSDERQFSNGLAPMDDIPSVTALFQDAAKCRLGPGNDLPT